jgi:hypothetical protein
MSREVRESNVGILEVLECRNMIGSFAFESQVALKGGATKKLAYYIREESVAYPTLKYVAIKYHAAIGIEKFTMR